MIYFYLQYMSKHFVDSVCRGAIGINMIIIIIIKPTMGGGGDGGEGASTCLFCGEAVAAPGPSL